MLRGLRFDHPAQQSHPARIGAMLVRRHQGRVADHISERDGGNPAFITGAFHRTSACIQPCFERHTDFIPSGDEPASQCYAQVHGS